MSNGNGDPRISSEHRAMYDAALNRAIPSLAHIFFRRPRNRPVAHATAVFVSVEGVPGILMADHSLDGDGKGPGDLLIGGPGTSDIVPLKGSRVRSTSFDPQNSQRVDVAVYCLAPETVAAISAFHPIPIDTIEAPAPYVRERRFAVVGFPSSKTNQATEPMRSGLMMYVARERAPLPPVEKATWLRPDLHLVLNFETDGIAHSHGHSNAPGLSGVSGGAVFDLGTTLDPTVSPRLAGIFTHHLERQKVLVATRLHPIVYGIKE
jgi:hypothetical protein